MIGEINIIFTAFNLKMKSFYQKRKLGETLKN